MRRRNHEQEPAVTVAVRCRQAPVREDARLRAWWLLAIGRCPGCPKTRHGQHKFGCNRPGVPAGMRAIRREEKP